MLKKILSCTAVGFFVTMSPLAAVNPQPVTEVSAAMNSFYDVPSTYWASKEINYLSSKSIIKGYESSKGSYFAPENSVTRAQAAKMILLALGEKEAAVSTAKFSDVPKSHWASGWIERAVQLGIFSGKSTDIFGPEDLLTRQQLSKILVNAFDIPIPADSAEPFVDVYINHEMRPYISALYNEGIATGSNGRFRPMESITRAQFSVFMARTLNPEFRVKVAEDEVGGVETQKPPVNVETETEAVALTSGLNVRSGPSANNGIIGQLSKGQKVPVISVSGYWAKVQFGSKTGYVNKLYLKLRNTEGNPVAERVIVLDAGHGGKDPGAIGAGITEKQIVIEVAKRVEAKLKAAGATIIMTRSGDTYPTLGDRVELAKDKYADMFVSIHVNSASPSASGTETFYDTSENLNGEESKKLAAEIQKQIIALVGTEDRGIKDNDFYVLRNNDMPSILVELGFITNSGDLAKLKSSKYYDLYAEAIYRGIVEYYKK
ncbi:N-acetylmuramoyl-L-alanine amidase [Bacillus songklensis]|uniref:N-acetylmuramoyl-L-alanine amidase n=1 Tax=Bacillus songklensis TaxID=1069116 RepID=A0ABV8BAY5_9BACI